VWVGQAFESGLLPLEVLVEAVRPVADRSEWGKGDRGLSQEDNIAIEFSHVFNNNNVRHKNKM
jgi:hypothetical protein